MSTTIASTLRNEELLSITALTRLAPAVGGKRPTPRTVRRWIVVGARGHRLEAIIIGGRMCSSREALERFLRAQQSELVPVGTEA